MKTNPMHIKQIEFVGNTMIIHGISKRVTLSLEKLSIKLCKANSNERNTYQISPSGLGVHWPLINEDLSFTNL